ncbi:hypothetical protein CIK05_07445 [Bdellovibrio sp. qaytius]|nr:hypothetical protein CIK05_07445 [Bdellovibrio sp. qaytius]
MKWLFVYLSLTLIACTPKSDQAAAKSEPAMSSEIALSDVSSGNCLNLEKLSRVFQNPLFSVPAAIMTTDLKAVGEMPISKLQYFAYATFNYRTANANELGLFTQIRQKDCKTVQMLSASEEVMTFEVTAATDKEITIKLVDKFRDNMTAAQHKGLLERQQPFEYTFKYLGPNRMTIAEKYTTVDPLCTSKTALTFEIHKDLAWAGRETDLPHGYGIEATYLNQVKESLLPEVQDQIATSETPQDIPIDTIRSVMRSALKAELKLCVQ